MFNGTRHCAGFLVAVMIFSASAVSWNPFSWFREELQVVKTVPPRSFFEEQLQNFQSSSYYAYGQKIHALGREEADKAYQKSLQLVQYVQQHPLETSALFSVAASVCIVCYLATLRHDVQKKDAWALWNLDGATDTRNTILIMDELLHEIQIRYIDLQHIEDFIGPVRRFIADIDQETHQLEAYAFYARKLHAVGLQRCIDMNLLDEIDQRIKRLHYLKMMCLQWLSKAKVGSLCVKN